MRGKLTVPVGLLRMSLGIVFIWFGALKLAGATPVAALVAGTVPWIDPDLLVHTLGVFEVVVGAALIVGRLLSWVAGAVAAHLAGTFLTLVMQPEVVFRDGNPLLLTTEGEFIVKNLVLVVAALVVMMSQSTRIAVPSGRTTPPVTGGAVTAPTGDGPALQFVHLHRQ